MKKSKSLRRDVVASALLLMAGPLAWAQPMPTPVHLGEGTSQRPARELPHVSREQYARQIETMKNAIADCRAAAIACDEAKAGEDVAVEGGAGGHGFDARLEWLRHALNDARKMKDAEREELMTKTAARLDEDAAEAAGNGEASPVLADARTKADAVLNRTEFREVQQVSPTQEAMAWLALMLNRLFEGADRHMPHSPWLVLAIEWSVLAAAATGLLLWAWRTTRQQRVALTGPAQEWSSQWQKESDDWARRAEVEAARGEWREAVHYLYWAAIVMLEGRKLWRPNRARTPREYLPLLEAGSARQRALGGLTRIFERIWYGLREAKRSDFEQAQALLEELKAA